MAAHEATKDERTRVARRSCLSLGGPAGTHVRGRANGRKVNVDKRLANEKKQKTRCPPSGHTARWARDRVNVGVRPCNRGVGAFQGEVALLP